MNVLSRMEVDNNSCFVEVCKGVRIPIGFRFRPTDEELLLHYLKRKIHSSPLHDVIKEQQVFDNNPWDLPGDSKDKRYFFIKDDMNVNQTRRKAGCGYWRIIGKDKPIFDYQIVGMKRTSYFFQRKKRTHNIKTWWIMQQFFLLDSEDNTRSTQSGDWVVCCIYQQKMRGTMKGVQIQESNNQSIIESKMMMIEEFKHKKNCLENPPSEEDLCSSCSSGVTDGMEMEVDDEDEEATSCGMLCYANLI